MPSLCRTLVAFGVILLAGSRAATACGCFDDPPCALFWHADAVFVGTVTEVTSESLYGTALSWRVAKISVTQVLRGDVAGDVTLVPNVSKTWIEATSAAAAGAVETSSSCDYRFEPRRTYLVYARRTTEGRLTTTMCAGTKPIDEATDDLDFVRQMPQSGSRGRVYGIVERSSDSSDSSSILRPAEKVRIDISGEGRRFQTRTDAKGRFELMVPAGKYGIRASVPDSLIAYQSRTDIFVPARGCAHVPMWLAVNGRAEGRLLGSDGGPVANASVRLVSIETDGTQPRSAGNPSATDENGQFLINGVPPGRYRLQVNAWGPSERSPYASIYYPGVPDSANATVIEIGEGKRRTGLDMIITKLVSRTISGHAMFPDGSPVVGAEVFLVIGITAIDVERTDVRGRFELEGFEGLSHVIRIVSGRSSVEHKLLVSDQNPPIQFVLNP